MKTILPEKILSHYRGPRLAQPNLIELQLESYKWFMTKGLRELFAEVFPIKDHTGKELELTFVDYKFDEPKYTEEKLHTASRLGEKDRKDLLAEALHNLQKEMIIGTSGEKTEKDFALIPVPH